MDVLDQLRLPLSRPREDPRPVVVMTCGIAGSGKSTLAKAIVARHPNYTRLSIDSTVYAKHGLYGTDYPHEKYDEYTEEADTEIRRTLTDLLDSGERDIVLDRALYSKEDRDYFKKLVEEKGGRWILVFFRPASKDVIWNRIQRRRAAGIDADSALEITPEILDQYWEGFENPEGEGEVVFDVTE
ncbi:P-loop containing nucleoside triphosphate hydrolase protein [Westerdykella ornata]|uniref:P-loop containing nucleoside triphosphate hydrolase protein n=1 Tax=Westerdykella ornata TaxID=318751 RepID=A0A6A6JBD4_WESOR|nr:P-loop containing nucleoside triphosphate hydrolase protein [Westerdykella ornata]KAF2273901.1 P-loop containing nucleoside triphosphate hydrolase protein [Westerdykella ornata]